MKLHLVNDEKIINRTIGEFDSVFPCENLWVVANRKSRFELIDKRPNVIGRAEFLDKYAKNGEFVFDEIFIHLLNPRKIKIISKLNLNRSRVYWIIWGMDLYNKLLVPKGFKLYAPGNSICRKSAVARFFKSVGAKFEAWRTLKFIQNHVDYIVTDTTENDYDYLVNAYPAFAVKPHKDFFYYPIDVILNRDLMEAEVNGTDIMIGNSASATNNHEYVFDLLSRLNIRGRRVVVPLSYSGKKDYVNSVRRKGENLFGESFVPLLDFLPLADYNRQQLATSVALFGNFRQEAIGNIIIALYLGAKVFLLRRNPVYEWAKGHGLYVFDLEKMTQADIDTPLEKSLQNANRRVLKTLYSRQRMHELIAAL